MANREPAPGGAVGRGDRVVAFVGEAGCVDEHELLVRNRGLVGVRFASRALKEVDHGIALLRPGGGDLTGQVRIGATHTFNVSLIPTRSCLAVPGGSE